MRVFVYGTLKPGEANYQHYCAAKVATQVNAIALGSLFSLPCGYPAMTLGNNRVRGYLLSFTATDILHQLDELENYNQNRPTANNLYNRQLINTYNLNGTLSSPAWAYLMHPEQVAHLGGICLPDGWWSDRGLSAEEPLLFT